MSKRKTFVNFVTAESMIFLLAATVFAFALRLKFLPFESGDYHQFLHPWFTALQQGGGLAAVGKSIGDYMAALFLPAGSADLSAVERPVSHQMPFLCG